MSKQLVYLEYCFMFDPSELWVRLGEFEKELADFFAANGKEVTTIENLSDRTKRILYIKPIENTAVPTLTKKSVPNEIKLPVMRQMGKP